MPRFLRLFGSISGKLHLLKKNGAEFFSRFALNFSSFLTEGKKLFAFMKKTKHTEITVETFEKTIIHYKQKLSDVYCAKCQGQISELPLTEIVLARPLSASEGVYLVKTKSGLWFLLKI